MPGGVDLDVLYAAAVRLFGEEVAAEWWAWFAVEHREWGQEGWRRLDQARAAPPCAPP